MNPEERVDAALAVLHGTPRSAVAARLRVEDELVDRWVELFVEGGRLRLAGRLDPSSFEARDRFLVLIAHEFRTPLTTILGWAEMLQSDQLPPELHHQGLQAIVKQATHLERVGRDALDAGAVAQGKLRLHLAPVGLRALLAEVVAGDGLVVVEAGPEVEVVADGSRLERVASEVVAHARRLAAGAAVVAVRVDASHDERVSVTVSVPARALSYEDAADLFEPYRRGDSSVGTGLGLFLGRAVLAAHGGEIGVRSGEEGTEFWFRLPRSGPEPGPLVERHPTLPYSLSCGDVMPGCAARFEADTEDDLLGEVAGHAAADHGITEITPDVLSQVRAAITER